MTDTAAYRLHSAGRRRRADRRRRQGLCRGRRARRHAGAGSVVVQCPRQAQYRPVRRRASAGAGRDRLEPRAWTRQGADRGAVQSRPQRQRDHGIAGAACGDHGRDRGRCRFDPMATALALARVVANTAQERRGTADLRHDVSVLDPQLPAAVLDGGGRRRSRRGRSPGGAAAALHGGQPRQWPCRCVLRRRALEFGRGRSRRRPHPAFRLRHPGARGREGARGQAKLVGKESGRAGGPGPGGLTAPPNSSRSPETAPRPRMSWRGPTGSASAPR